MKEYFKKLIEYHELIYMMTLRSIRVKYKQSIMGIMWAFFMPLVIIFAGILVKYAIAKVSGNAITLSQINSVLVKATPWSFFIASVRFATMSLTNNLNLVTKIYFPREILPISAVLSQLFDFIIASCLLIIVLCFTQIGISVYILFAPLYIIMLIIIIISLGLFFSAANLFYRDVKYIVEVITTFAIFFTPVFYEAESAGQFKNILLINPVSCILEGLYSCVIVKQLPEINWLVYCIISSGLLFYFSYHLFKKMEPIFAESI